MKLVITMSRRFGTGASIIAGELSERLGIPVYDKAYIEEKLNDHMYESEAEAIRKLAEKPCIILGRCASDILKDRMNVLNIFVCADKEDRIQRIMGKDGLSYEDAKEKICATIQMLYQKYRFLLEGDTLNEQEKTEFNQVSSGMREYVQDSLASLGAGFGSALADIIHLRIPAQPRGAYIRWGIDTRH